MRWVVRVGIKELMTKLKGITKHFNLSNVGAKCLANCLAAEKLPTVMPQPCSIRWNGKHDLTKYYSVAQKAIQKYDVQRLTEAATAVPNPDGSTYGDYVLNVTDWTILHQVVRSTMTGFVSCAVWYYEYHLPHSCAFYLYHHTILKMLFSLLVCHC